MKYSKRIISFLAALAVSVSFTSCKEKEEPEKNTEEEIPEVTEQEPVQEPEEKGNEYKLTSYYEEIPLANMSSLTGEITDILYGGNQMYAITDDTAYTSGSGLMMCNIDLTTMKRSEIYNAPTGYFYASDDISKLPEGVELGENDRLFTVFTDRVIYGNEKGVCVKDFKTGLERVIELAGTTDMDVLGAFCDGKKYVLVYQEKAQTLKHFYAASAEGEVIEETKMTLGYDGNIEKAYVNSAGDLYFTKVERSKETTVVSATETKTTEYTKIELYRMKPDGSLSRQVGGEKLPYEIKINDFFVSGEGDIYIQESDPVKGSTIQQFDCYGIRTATYNIDPEANAKYFASGSELWAAFTDEDGSVGIAPVDETGVIQTAQKIYTDAGTDYKLLAGDAVYDAYLSDAASVYGIRFSERTIEEVMQWADADIDIKDRNCIGIKDAGDIYCLTKQTLEIMIEESAAADDIMAAEAAENETAAAEGEEKTDSEEDADEDQDEADSEEESEDEDSDDEDSEEDSEDEEDEENEEDEEDSEETDEDDDKSEPDAAKPSETSAEAKPKTRTEEYLRPIRLAKASEQRLEELNSRRIITVAGDIYTTFNVYGEEYSVPELIKEFNRNNDKYFIHPKNYNRGAVSADGAENGLEKLEKEMEDGFTPDFIIYNPADNDFSSYAKEGKFAEIRDLMAGDPEVKEDDLMSNIAEFCTVDNVMYRIFPFFTGRTYFANESATDGKGKWKMSDFLEEATVYNTVYPHEEAALEDILSVYASVNTDFEEKTCKFDTEEFRDVLRWADAFDPVEGAGPAGDKVYDIRFEKLSTPARLNYEETVTQEEQIARGIPSGGDAELEVTPGICFSVLKTSDCKDVSWSFIRQFFTDNFYSWGEKRELTESQIKARISPELLPVRTSVMEKLIADSTSMKYEKMLNGDDYAPTVITTWGEEYDLPDVSAATAEKFRKAVNGNAYLSIRGTEYFDILMEESSKYFTDPEMTVEDASANVQRRALAYLMAH